VKNSFHKQFFVAGLLALLMLTVMAIQGAALKTAATPLGILDLEFAKTTTRVEEILLAWKYLNNTALWNTLIDFGFLTAYTFFFSKGMQYLLSIVQQPWLQKNRRALQKMTSVPGYLDAIENGFMLGWLLNIIPSFSPSFVYWMVWIKFILAGVLLIVCFPAWVYNAYQLFKKNK
jgi:hypothetical protein